MAVSEKEIWREAITDEMGEPLGEIVQSPAEEEGGSFVHAHLLIWQFEDFTHGLRNLKSVQKDAELYGLCAELITLLKREAAGDVLSPDEWTSLHVRILKAWDASGERKRKETVAFARKWAFLGARRWAWISSRGWTKTWNWLIVATKSRNYSSVTALILAWSGAWKWARFWEAHHVRMNALTRYFREIITTS